MTPQQKAKEIFDKYDQFPLTIEWKKQCSIICIEEILWGINDIEGEYNMADFIDWWEEVLEELKNI